MITQERLEKLLSEEESIYLEYKENLELDSARGKAKFLREVLSLANSPIRNAFIVIGVEDKTKTLVGLKNNITEEQIQQVISEWCRPPVRCTYQNIEYKNKTFGVVEVYPLRPPYTLKKSTGYDEPTDDPKRPKKIKLRENQVFIRRGSTIEDATIDELLEMFQADTADLSDIVTRLDYVNESLEEIASRTSNLRYLGEHEERNELLEIIFISMMSALIIGAFWNSMGELLPVAALPVVALTMIICSTFRVTHFGVMSIIIIGLTIAMALSGWFAYSPRFTAIEDIIANWYLLGVLYHGLAGAAIGLVAGIVFQLWRPFDLH